MNALAVTWTVEDDDGEEVEFSLPGRYEVCSGCEGHGTHLHPAIGEHAYTRKEFAEAFDEDEAHEYFTRGGRWPAKTATASAWWSLWTTRT